jgi:hypothetical protein
MRKLQISEHVKQMVRTRRVEGRLSGIFYLMSHRNDSYHARHTLARYNVVPAAVLGYIHTTHSRQSQTALLLVSHTRVARAHTVYRAVHNAP